MFVEGLALPPLQRRPRAEEGMKKLQTEGAEAIRFPSPRQVMSKGFGWAPPWGCSRAPSSLPRRHQTPGLVPGVLAGPFGDIGTEQCGGADQNHCRCYICRHS